MAEILCYDSVPHIPIPASLYIGELASQWSTVMCAQIVVPDPCIESNICTWSSALVLCPGYIPNVGGRRLGEWLVYRFTSGTSVYGSVFNMFSEKHYGTCLLELLNIGGDVQDQGLYRLIYMTYKPFWSTVLRVDHLNMAQKCIF